MTRKRQAVRGASQTLLPPLSVNIFLIIVSACGGEEAIKAGDTVTRESCLVDTRR